MKPVDKLLDSITMYRLVVYVLSIYVGLAVIFSFLGRLSFSPTHIIISLGLIIIPAFITDKLFGRLYKAPTNSESWLITSLIIFLIVQPADSLSTGLALVLGGALSSASKFLLAYTNKHIFNPAALAAAVLSITAIQTTTWWIGNSAFWPFTLVLGLAIVRKIRRVPLVLTFVCVSIVLQIFIFVLQHQAFGTGMKGALLASPLIFLATIMLTEPATMPPRRAEQIIFGAIVAALYVTSWRLGPFIIYPEVALLLGNVYAFAVSPKFRVRLRLIEIQQISERVYNYVFQPHRSFSFIPGQYMEWTLAGVPYDSRGNRRTFTLASSPTEQTVHVGLKYYQPASAYKATFSTMKIGDTIDVSQLAGNFSIDPDGTGKLAFIAGGIGITPFRSMIKYLLDKNIQRDITLLYIVSDPTEYAYNDVFMEASRIGVKLVPIVTQPTYEAAGIVSAKFSQALLEQLIPDYAERQFYISGPSTMVDATKQYLKNLQVTATNIKTDHFTGY